MRFRPIMMTTMAALLGGVPLMLDTGTGSEIRQPLGYAMVGGLIVSQALTLSRRWSSISISTGFLMHSQDGAVRPILTMIRIWTLAARSSKQPNDLTLRGNRPIRR